MRRYLVLCENPGLAVSLRASLVQTIHVADDQISSRTVGAAPRSVDIARQFEHLAAWLESQSEIAGNTGGSAELVVFTDLCGYGYVTPSDLSPVKNQGWLTVLGMLILTFPEFHWIFSSGTWANVPNGGDFESNDWVGGSHSVIQMRDLRAAIESIDRSLPTLFDGTGIRDEIRRALAVDEGADVPHYTRRHAVAIDEERNYSWLHAYAAYRQGFRSHAVTTFAGMRFTLGEDGLKPALVFEDLFLNFADEHPDGFSRLRYRDQIMPRLRQAKCRILVTVGYGRSHDDFVRKDNNTYIKELRAAGQWIRELSKPIGGVFNIWRDAGLERRSTSISLQGERESSPIGQGLPYKTPKHSAPGRLLAIGETLITRAERLLSEVRSVPTAIHGAVLATEALRLLGNRTPTTSLQALALRHHFEAIAECQFVGMREHIDVDERMREIQRAALHLSDRFGAQPRQRAAAAWNAELSILNKLVDVFREYMQFDEEQRIMARVRALNRKLRFASYPRVVRPLELIPWYVEKLVASFPLFVSALLGWIAVLGFLYTWVGGVPWHQGLADAFTSFLGVQPPSDTDLWQPQHSWNGIFWLIAFTVALGFAHLGIFISHLYSLISRK